MDTSSGTLSAWTLKRGSGLTKSIWQKRFVVLDPAAKTVSYFDKPDGVLKGTLQIAGFVDVKDRAGKKGHRLDIKCAGREELLSLSFEDAVDGKSDQAVKAEWLACLAGTFPQMSPRQRTDSSVSQASATLTETQQGQDYDPGEAASADSQAGAPPNFLRISILSAKGLVAKDRSGSSDPAVTVKVGNEKTQRTPEIRQSLDPSWNKLNKFKFKCTDINTSISLTVEDFDGTRGAARYEFMGKAVVTLADFADGEPKTQTFRLTEKNGNIAKDLVSK
jgi:hypothetical protein